MKLFTTYRVLALAVGVLLAFCSLIVFPAAHFAAPGSGLQKFGEDFSIMWVAHGWIFMIYVVVAFLLSRRAGWSPAFTVVALVAGLVPLLIFWVEHTVASKVKDENPEIADASVL